MVATSLERLAASPAELSRVEGALERLEQLGEVVRAQPSLYEAGNAGGSYRSPETLVDLLIDRKVGVIEVDRPQLALKVSDQGTNLEETFAPWLNAESDDETALPELSIRVTDGTLQLHDTQRDKDPRGESCYPT